MNIPAIPKPFDMFSPWQPVDYVAEMGTNDELPPRPEDNFVIRYRVVDPRTNR